MTTDILCLDSYIKNVANLKKELLTRPRKHWAIVAGVGTSLWCFSSIYKNYHREMFFMDNIMDWTASRLMHPSLAYEKKDGTQLIKRMNPFLGAIYWLSFRKWSKRVISIDVDKPTTSIQTILHYQKDQNNSLKPLFFWIHGGGYVLGEAADDWLGICAQHIGDFVVASVDYRKSPSHKFPTPPKDCFAALKHLLNNAEEYGIDSNNVIVAGFSAGGNAATVVALMAQKEKIDIHLQLLFCPMTRYGATTRSYIEWGGRVWLSSEMMIWFWHRYTNNLNDARNQLCCPIEGKLQGISPALVVTASCDVLRDEGVEYAKALKHNGVKMTHIQLRGSHLGAMIFDTKGMKKVFDTMKAMLRLS